MQIKPAKRATCWVVVREDNGKFYNGSGCDWVWKPGPYGPTCSEKMKLRWSVESFRIFKTKQGAEAAAADAGFDRQFRENDGVAAKVIQAEVVIPEG